jgi:hypothetical protein
LQLRHVRQNGLLRLMIGDGLRKLQQLRIERAIVLRDCRSFFRAPLIGKHGNCRGNLCG